MGNAATALVTGSNGFLGSHLVEALLTAGYEVHCLVRRTSDLTWLRGLPVRLVYGDVTSESTLQSAVAGRQYVYHAAGLVKARSQWAFDRVNAGGTANLLRACSQWNAGLKRFVLVSSQSAAGPCPDRWPVDESHQPSPVSRYGRSKLKGEAIATKYMARLPVTIVRPPAVFGPKDRGFLPFFKMLKAGIVILPRGTRRANFAYVKDVVQGLILAAEREAALGQVYYIAAERGYTWRQFARTAAAVVGRRPVVLSVPETAVRVLGGVNTLAGALTGRARILDCQKANEILHPTWLCDISKATNELGYRPRFSLEAALTETIEWYRMNDWI